MIRLIVVAFLLVGFCKLSFAADLALPGSISIGVTPIGATKVKVIKRAHKPQRKRHH